MSGNYMQCPECGKRALSIATRCPHCGHEFSRMPEPDRPLELRRSLRVLAVAAGTVALIAIMLGIGRWIRRTPHEHGQPIAAIAPETVAESTSVIEPDSAAAAPMERRFARTWTKVRTGRSTKADVAAVLLPGDTVLVDSLVRGWWRVTLEGKAMGYVHRSTVQAEPPPADTPPAGRPNSSISAPSPSTPAASSPPEPARPAARRPLRAP